ncbi:hypothetical protein RIB2604_01601140 [Aspergillus luchuensis]|uniref:Uncharacterized protein n=1 Tax=Aspergillus kawachii TaxID=1069201 RepID=A0A146FAJ9_ASPKA|nr:hypothetical protein RIB2604_01601140 [Aspergillus luchuensis]
MVDASTEVPDSPRAWQEQVNFLGLSSQTIHNMPLKSASHIPREQFLMLQFEARTDGYLADSSGDIKAIVEVKPMLRQTKEPQIGIQESHQMVAGLLMDYKSSLPARRNKP